MTALFTNLKMSNGTVKIGKGKLFVEGKGQVEIQISDKCGGWILGLSHVLYAPELEMNLPLFVG